LSKRRRFSKAGVLTELRGVDHHESFAAVFEAQLPEVHSNSIGIRASISAGHVDWAYLGLTIENRPGLRQMIEDVERGSPGYSTILVYDISRWGRFQDADESAYYEYHCRRANIAVHYCAEAFANDGSLLAALLKTIKRTMAAEYSRELSTPKILLMAVDSDEESVQIPSITEASLLLL